MGKNVDQMLDEIGSFGRYQWTLLSIYGFALITLDAFPTMIASFITAEPDWICVKDHNNTLCNFTEPITLTSKQYKARCSMPREAWTYVEEFTSTVTEYDLVCDKSYLQSVAQSCFWVGMFLGLSFGGYLADKFGRKIVYCSGCVGLLVATWIMVFPKTFVVFIVFRTFTGLFLGFLNSSGFVLITEYAGKTNRAKIGIYSFYFWVAAMPILALLGYFLPNWRYFLLATVALGTPCLFAWCFMPESARWLVLKGKNDKARKQLAKVANVNKKTLPEDDLKKPDIPQTGNILQLIRNRETRRRFIVNCDLWVTVALVYYGVSYGSVDLGWNRYLTFALVGLIELPSNYTAIWSAERFGRKKSTAVSLVCACIASVVAVSIPYDQSRKATVSTIFRIIVAVLAKFCINLSFCVVYVWTVELFPTFVRSTALSLSSTAGRLGSFLSSYVIWLIRIHPVLPFGIMGFFCFQAAVLTIFLPETKGQPTMESMVDLDRKQDSTKEATSLKEPTIHTNKPIVGGMYLDDQL